MVGGVTVGSEVATNFWLVGAVNSTVDAGFVEDTALCVAGAFTGSTGFRLGAVVEGNAAVDVMAIVAVAE